MLRLRPKHGNQVRRGDLTEAPQKCEALAGLHRVAGAAIQRHSRLSPRMEALMKRSLLLALLATLPIGLALAAQPAGAQMREPAIAQGREPGIALAREPYGIGLEGFAYP